MELRKLMGAQKACALAVIFEAERAPRYDRPHQSAPGIPEPRAKEERHNEQIGR